MKSKIGLAFVSVIMALGIIVSAYYFINHDNDSQASSLPTELTSDLHTITVQGEGKITKTPDVAYLSIGVQTENAKVETAQKENTNKFNKVYDELINLGINKKDIKTQDYSVNPSYSNNGKIKSYYVSNTVNVTVRDTSKCGKIIDTVTSKDANIIYGIEFKLSDSSQAYSDALKLAMEDAKNKAKALAEGLGNVTIKPIKVSEEPIESNIIYNGGMNYKMAEDSVSTKISEGESEVKAKVSIIYEMK